MSTGTDYNPPQAREGKPWWVWALGGCGGCLVVVLIASVAIGFMGKRMWDSTATGPITAASIQRDLGDIPVYPGARLDLTASEIAMRSLRMTEKMSGKKLFMGAGAFATADPQEKVLAYYEEKLPAAGWKLIKTQKQMNQVQQQYQRGKEMAMVQVQRQQQTVLILMRGNEGLK